MVSVWSLHPAPAIQSCGSITERSLSPRDSAYDLNSVMVGGGVGRRARLEAGYTDTDTQSICSHPSSSWLLDGPTPHSRLAAMAIHCQLCVVVLDAMVIESAVNKHSKQTMTVKVKVGIYGSVCLLGFYCDCSMC